MKSKIRTASILLVLIVGVLFLIPATRHKILGFVRGEPFQEGMPLSYWIAEVQQGLEASEYVQADIDRRYRAAGALRQMGAKAKPAVPALIAALRDDRVEKTLTAQNIFSRYYDEIADTLGKIGPDAVEAVPALFEAGGRKWSASSFHAAEAIEAIGPEGLPHVIKALQHENPQVRFDAVHVLSKWGAPAKPALPALLRIIQDPANRPAGDGSLKTSNVFYCAAVSLGNLGPEAHEAVPVILEAIQEGVAIQTSGGTIHLSREPLTSLIKIDGSLGPLLAADDGGWAIGFPGGRKGAFEYLTRALTSKKKGVPEYAALLLGQELLHFTGDHTVPNLAELTKSLHLALNAESTLLRWNAAAALAFEPKWENVKPALPVLCEALKMAKVERVKLRAAKALERIALRGAHKRETGPEVQTVVPTLLEVWHESKGRLWPVGQALKAIDAEAAVKAGVP